MTEQQMKEKIIEKADVMAKALLHGKDIELRKSMGGVSVAEVSKKVVAR